MRYFKCKYKQEIIPNTIINANVFLEPKRNETVESYTLPLNNNGKKLTYFSKSQIQEIKSQEYSCEDALKMELEDIEKLIEITNNIAVTFGDKYKDVDDIFSSYTSDLGKFKYFIASMI